MRCRSGSSPAGVERPPSPCTEVESEDISLSTPAYPGQPAPPGRADRAVLAVPGNHDAIDVWLDAPPTWGDVVFEVGGTVVGTRVPFSQRPAGSVQTPRTPATANRIRGLLFSLRGRAVSEFDVRCYTPDVAVEGVARLIARAWTSGEQPTDQQGRAVVDPFARPDQQWLFSTAGGGLNAGAPTQVVTATPRGTGVAVTGIDWSSAAAAAVRLVLEAIHVGGPTVLWSGILPAGGALAAHFTQPIFTPMVPGLTLQARYVVPGDEALGELSVQGFFP